MEGNNGARSIFQAASGEIGVNSSQIPVHPPVSCCENDTTHHKANIRNDRMEEKAIFQTVNINKTFASIPLMKA